MTLTPDVDPSRVCGCAWCEQSDHGASSSKAGPVGPDLSRRPALNGRRVCGRISPKGTQCDSLTAIDTPERAS